MSISTGAAFGIYILLSETLSKFRPNYSYSLVHYSVFKAVETLKECEFL